MTRRPSCEICDKLKDLALPQNTWEDPTPPADILFDHFGKLSFGAANTAEADRVDSSHDESGRRANLGASQQDVGRQADDNLSGRTCASLKIYQDKSAQCDPVKVASYVQQTDACIITQDLSTQAEVPNDSTTAQIGDVLGMSQDNCCDDALKRIEGASSHVPGDGVAITVHKSCVTPIPCNAVSSELHHPSPAALDAGTSVTDSPHHNRLIITSVALFGLRISLLSNYGCST